MAKKRRTSKRTKSSLSGKSGEDEKGSPPSDESGPPSEQSAIRTNGLDGYQPPQLCQLSTKKRVLVERIIARITKYSTIDGFTEEEILSVLAEAYQLLHPVPSLVHVDVPVAIFGDIHGQLADLQRFLSIVEAPPKKKLLFLGDYVDRCNKGLEVALLLLCYKLRYPAHIDMLRGNHECSKMNRIYGFYVECRGKMSIKVWKAFQRAFDELPLCARVGKRILAMHGGISPEIRNWESLISLKKPRTNAECDEGIALDLMWSDPSRDDCTKGFQPNIDRGTSYLFGDDMVRHFNRKLDIDLVVRAHEVVKNGHLFNASYQMCTIFSAPNYCGSEGNYASVMLVSKELDVSFVTLKPRMNQLAHSQLSKNDLLLMQERFLRANAKSPKPGFRPLDSKPNIDVEGNVKSSAQQMASSTPSQHQMVPSQKAITEFTKDEYHQPSLTVPPKEPPKTDSTDIDQCQIQQTNITTKPTAMMGGSDNIPDQFEIPLTAKPVLPTEQSQRESVSEAHQETPTKKTALELKSSLEETEKNDARWKPRRGEEGRLIR